MSRIKEIQDRLKATEGLKNPDADDISHDHNVGFPIEDERCELYANSKSDIEFLLAEIEKRDRAIEKLKEQRNKYLDMTDWPTNALGKAIAYDKKIEDILK